MQIQIDALSKSYSKGTHALDNLTLSIGSGMFGLLGPNGAGKSTFMQILATLQRPTSGDVAFGSLKIGRDDQQIRELLGYLPQEFGVYKKLTAYEYLDYVALMKGLSNTIQRKLQVNEVLEQVNLTSVRNKKIGGFSGGMKQRVGIAQALLGNPQVIIVDEPTVGLDPEERIRFRNLLGEWSESKIIILSTHIVSDIESSCSRLAIMRQGKLLFHGTQDELLVRVADQVWVGVVTEAELARLRETGTVATARKTQNGYEVRVISNVRPFDDAIAASPGLEDAYMRMTGGTAIG
ncbi:ABC transporter ATP-binding protein [Cohnella abietis]|uniref:Multidrug ABC transporter ATP-binding protein n=1 Tax=Cohnella abietis TaxID=2507935 RepID=A0A3T1DAS8_9BACL|nr:ABC transporter ATP-binding protein [Cohnella abietis]BBI35190.1 multidrug ABC transporter ATP-binding protein [Cohnella abietis]